MGLGGRRLCGQGRLFDFLGAEKVTDANLTTQIGKVAAEIRPITRLAAGVGV